MDRVDCRGKELYVLVEDFLVAYPSGEHYDERLEVLEVLEYNHDHMVIRTESWGNEWEVEYELRRGVWWEINSEGQFIVLDFAHAGDSCAYRQLNPTRVNAIVEGFRKGE